MSNKFSGYHVSISSKKQKADDEMNGQVLGSRLCSAYFAVNCSLQICGRKGWTSGQGFEILTYSSTFQLFGIIAKNKYENSYIHWMRFIEKNKMIPWLLIDVCMGEVNILDWKR